MNRHLLSALVCAALAAPLGTAAQSKTEPKPAGATAANSTDQFVMRDGEVVLRQGSTIKPLSKNAMLADGTKVNYKSGIVELPGGKKTTLKEGDYVTIKGEIVFATPGSAAAARGDQSVPATAQYDTYVDRNSPTSTTDMETRLSSLNSRLTLMARKIQLLNDKISLLSTATQRPADTSQLDQQIKALDEQLQQVK
ncbi:hypothetical protein SAMN02745146_0047 [Hymenobacter daecheongensis DSM 21074]|uniref:DUF6799 domain-containing protein n=1 Tax=Hymenobacter daecheongensis DSM 21074 TaxID=1121955 RepID=A0A1M6LTB6_9BACT|nr:DUF6799 domain-containing protein [Hymenobacter daecheongensis]SHJ74488.1 hypothetical protein SAMN02745146_0047 [Hymenobacter daecheongensis DSM 21074]